MSFEKEHMMVDLVMNKLTRKMAVLQRAQQLADEAHMFGEASAAFAKSAFTAMMKMMLLHHFSEITVGMSQNPAERGMYRVLGVEPVFVFSVLGLNEVRCGLEILELTHSLIDVRMRLSKQYRIEAEFFLQSAAEDGRWTERVNLAATEALSLIGQGRAEIIPVIYDGVSGPGTPGKLVPDPSMLAPDHWALRAVGMVPIFCGFAPDGTFTEGPGEHKGWMVTLVPGK